MVREEDAQAFVVIARQALVLLGKTPVITPVNERRLVHLGALMWDAFGVGTTEDSDG